MKRLGFLLAFLTACGAITPPVSVDPCAYPLKVVVTLDKTELLVGQGTQAHAAVYDSAGKIVLGCQVVWSVK